MNIKSKMWITKHKLKGYITSEYGKTKLRFVKASVLALILGFFASALIVVFTGYNGFSFIINSFRMGLKRKSVLGQSNLTMSLEWMCIFAMLGLGLSLGFKVKLFNMGGSGQALLGFMFTLKYLSSVADHKGVAITDLNKHYIIIVFILFILAGILFSLTIGSLKIFFNIHEVASSIMLNWIAYYLLRWSAANGRIATDAVNTSWLMVGHNGWILPLAIVLVVFAITFIVITFTKWGYKFKVIGSSLEVARYAGIKNNIYILVVTAIQGVIMSIGCLFYYFCYAQNQEFSSGQMLTLGFDAISVSLISFNNIFGILFISFIWGVLKVGSDSATRLPIYNGINSNISTLIFGAITFCAAIYIIFYNFDIINTIKHKLYIWRDKDISEFIKYQKNEIKSNKISIKNIRKSPEIAAEIETLKKIQEDFKKLGIDKKTNNNIEKNIEYENLRIEIDEFLKKLSEKISNQKHIFQKQIHEIKNETNDFIENRKQIYYQKSIIGLKKKFYNLLSKRKFEVIDAINLLSANYSEYVQDAKRVIKANDILLKKINSDILKIDKTSEEKANIILQKYEDKGIKTIDQLISMSPAVIEEFIKSDLKYERYEIVNYPIQNANLAKNYSDFKVQYQLSKKDFSLLVENYINDYKQYKNKLLSVFKINWNEAKDYVSKLNKEYRERIREASNKLLVQIELREKQMEVCDNYGSFNINN
ncbi:ABC transporter permease subunit [Spiroplasma endosymbiont of Aspidapion aeneum]|uniref:ABC transporter permease subunit n=1 Tax=Spiroplasma endosymbiont of Aspidapion aeneum TaxID=3066276 RepID=UPI00313BA71B